MQKFCNELITIYQIDVLRLRSKLFVFIFNLLPDLYLLRFLKNFLLLLAGCRINILFTYIKNRLYFDNAHAMTIGKGVFINRNVGFEGLGEIVIGDSVQIGPNVQFTTTEHKNRGQDETQNINVGNNVWIGANCVILPGSEIGDNINIAAGSIVKGKILDGSLWAGSPAVKKR